MVRPPARHWIGPLALLLITPLASAPTAVSLLEHGSQAAAATSSCSLTWAGHESDIEEFLRTAPVAKLENLSIGVTKPRRALFESGGIVASAAWKPLPPAFRNGFRESYKAEIAAYLIDRMLELNMVPPAVERRLDNQRGAIVYWVDNTKMWDNEKPPKGPEPGWSRQISRMKLFDQLIANIDRNAGNILYDQDWHIILIDHSRAFIEKKDLRGMQPLQTVDKTLWERMEALTADTLTAGLGEWVSRGEIQALLARRDRMREAIAKLVKERGEQAVYLR